MSSEEPRPEGVSVKDAKGQGPDDNNNEPTKTEQNLLKGTPAGDEGQSGEGRPHAKGPTGNAAGSRSQHGKEEPKKRKSRLRYTRAELFKIGENPELKSVPYGFDPNILKSMDASSSPFDGPGLDGPRRSWRNNAGMTKVVNSRLVQPDSIEPEDMPDGHGGGGRGRGRGWGLGPRQSWRSEADSEQGAGRGSFNRRNSRSDGPGRWDQGKDDEWKNPKPGPPGMGDRPRLGEGQRWHSYGHRDGKDRPGGWKVPEDEPRGSDPEWMHDTEAAGTNQKERAAAFEKEKIAMRKQWAEKPGGMQGQQPKDPNMMTDEDFEQMKLEDKAAESNTYSFDSFKEAFKQGAAGDMPPLPQSFNTVDEIEKGLKHSSRGHALGVAPGMGGGQAAQQLQGANLLLSMLRGAQRPQQTNPLVAMAAAQQQQQQQQLQQRLQLQQQLQAQRAHGQHHGLPFQMPNNGGMGQVAADNVIQRLFAAAAQRQVPPSASILGLGGLQGQQGYPNAQLQQNLLQQAAGQRSPLLAALHQMHDARAAQVAQQQAQVQAVQQQAHAQAQAFAAQQRAAQQQQESESFQQGMTGEGDASLSSTKSAPAATGMMASQVGAQGMPAGSVAPMGSHLIMPDGTTIVRPQYVGGGVPANMLHPGMVRPGAAVSMGPLIDQFNKNPVPIIGGHPVRPAQPGIPPGLNVGAAGLERFFALANQHQQNMQGNPIPSGGRAQNLEDLEGVTLT